MGNYESITEEEKSVFADTWALISANLVDYGNTLFNVIFSDFPLMANYFPFSGPDDDRFEGHTATFINELDAWAQNLRRPDAARQLINAMGASHSKHNIRPEEFDNLRECFLRTVSTRMGPMRFGREQHAAFYKIVTVAFDFLQDASDRERVNRLSVM